MSGAVKVAVPLAIGAAAMYATGGTAGVAGAGGAAYTGSTSMMTTLAAGGGGGGLMAGAASISPMTALFAGTQALSFMQGIQQGDIMKNQYKIQELQTLAQMETDRFNAIKTSMDRFDRLKRIQAANISKSYAGGVSGLDGSALLNQIVSDQEYGEDYKTDLMSIDRIATMGQVNADIYGSAADRAPTDAMLDAGIKLGTAAYTYSKLG